MSKEKIVATPTAPQTDAPGDIVLCNYEEGIRWIRYVAHPGTANPEVKGIMLPPNPDRLPEHFVKVPLAMAQIALQTENAAAQFRKYEVR